MKLRIKLYNILVNRVPAIQRKYHAIRQQKKGSMGRLYAWTALIGMNAVSFFCKRKFEQDFYFPDKGKKLPAACSESILSLKEQPKKLAERLAEYDVISFDVFDTLLLRPFACPTDLFFLIGEKLHYLDFERIRREIEWRARQKAKEKKGSYEITLSEIYAELEEQAGIPAKLGMKLEIETELSMCFGNPYMLELFRQLAKYQKKIICTSDMYLPTEVIQAMVEKCGFTGISEYFISCEYGASKGDGSLYKIVREGLGREKTFFHIGDNPVSDVESAVRNGFTAELYRNVNIAGMPYRAEDMSIITGSMYRGVVNAHIHNGLAAYSKEYELGYIYGGIFVLGYCQWIHEYVRTQEIDKVLFLSRDGDILQQVYTILYPEESMAGRTEYVYWSRLTATKMAARYFKYDYFRRFLDHKINQGYTLEQIFVSMEIEDMIPRMCQELPDFFKVLIKSDKTFDIHKRALADIRREVQITKETKLTDKNAWIIKEYLLAHWEEVLSHYEEQLKAGKQYYAQVLRGCKRAVAVDVGWAGSGAVALNHIVKDIWKLDCEVTGLLAGTNTVHNAEPNMSEPQLLDGKLVSYLYSQGHNRELWKFHDAAKGHNLYWELLLSSPQPSFKGFGFTDGKVAFHFKKPEKNPEGIKELQKGILDFVTEWSAAERGNSSVTGSDAYAVSAVLLNKKNRTHVNKILAEFGQEVNVE